MVDGKLRPRRRHLENWTLYMRRLFDSGLFGPLYKNMTSYAKKEIHNVMKCRQRWTERRSR